MTILKYATTDERLSNEVNPRATPYMGPHRSFRSHLRSRSRGYDVVVPFFIPSDDPEATRIRKDEEILEENPELADSDEFIRIHYLTVDENGTPTACDTPVPYGLSW